jgi:hypothetical protein
MDHARLLIKMDSSTAYRRRSSVLIWRQRVTTSAQTSIDLQGGDCVVRARHDVFALQFHRHCWKSELQPKNRWQALNAPCARNAVVPFCK